MEPAEQSSNRILTIPNLVSFARLLGVGLFWWVLLVDDNVALAAWLIFIIGWTDWIDGYLARKLNQASELGKALDPVADRLMIVSAIVGGLIAGVVPALIAVPLLIREAVMGAAALYLAGKGGGTLEVRRLGKYATFLLYGAIPSFYLAGADFFPGFFEPLAWISGSAGLFLYWYVMFQYLGDARSRLRELESPSDAPAGYEET